MHARTRPTAHHPGVRNPRDEDRPRPRRAVPGRASPSRRHAATEYADLVRLEDAIAMGQPASLRQAALRRIAEGDWSPRRRRAALMLLMHAALDRCPEVRFSALDGLATFAGRHPRLRARAIALLERWRDAPCRATAAHAARLLAGASPASAHEA